MSELFVPFLEGLVQFFVDNFAQVVGAILAGIFTCFIFIYFRNKCR